MSETFPRPWRAIKGLNAIVVQAANSKPLTSMIWREQSEVDELLQAAQLMASAPELREALAGILKAFDAPHRFDLSKAVIHARDLLAKGKA